MTTKNADTEKPEAIYPYGPIAVCLPIAEAVKTLGGINSPVSKASLASYLREDEKSARLMTKIASAKAFGMIEGRSNFKLTAPAVRFFTSTGQAHRSALMDFLESPTAFKKLVERFDGTLLPPVEHLATMLESDTEVPKSWRDRVAGFFLRSAKYAGAIDEAGHLRVKATRDTRFESEPKPADTDALGDRGGQIQPPILGGGEPENEERSDALVMKARMRGLNAASRSFSLSETDDATGQKKVVFAEVPTQLSLSTWKILDQWVESIKPEEKPK